MRLLSQAGTAGGVRPREMLPSFAVPAANGQVVRRWDYYARAALLILVLHGPDCPHCRALLTAIAAHGAAWEEAETQPLAIVRAAPAELAAVAAALPAGTGRRPLLLADADGQLRQELAGAEPGVVALVADRYGKVRHRARAADADGLDVADLVAWMAFVALQCAE
jgi:hypothetical protein